MTSARIQLPDRLMNRAEQLAERMGVSLDDLVRESLEVLFHEKATSAEEDPYLSDWKVFEGPTPSDVVERFDDYLYGDKG
jgi:hypothetical protein